MDRKISSPDKNALSSKRGSLRNSPVPIPKNAWVELPTSSLPKKPKLSPVKPNTPVARVTLPAKPTILAWLTQNKIHHVSSVEQAEQVEIFANKKLGLPDKFLAIYYVDLIYETIKRLSNVILDLIKVFGDEISYLFKFKENAVCKLKELIKFIDEDRYMYLPSDIKNAEKINIKEIYFFVKILIKKPRDRETFLLMITDILKAQEKDTYYMRKLVNDYTPLELKKHISWQYLHLTSKIIRYARCINIRSVGDKLQSLNKMITDIIDIITNLFNDDIVVSNFSGGYVFFPNLRFNRDDKEYTPLINKYIYANSNNFQNIYEYFDNIFKYYQKIDKKMADIYKKEYRNVDYNYPKPKLFYSYAHEAKYLRTKVGISKVEKQLTNISNGVFVKLFEEICKKKLKSLRDIIDNMQKETDNIYHKIR
jgi:hypothetical protein